MNDVTTLHAVVTVLALFNSLEQQTKCILNLDVI